MTSLEILPATRWPEVWALMRDRKFPGVPETWFEAEQAFVGCQALADATQPISWVSVFGPPHQGVAFLDVVCRNDQ